MRLWHQKLIPYLPRQQLLGLHRECCALRGAGWGRKHSVVDYVFTHEPAKLVAYHWMVMNEMLRRGYHPDMIWYNYDWRGNTLQKQEDWCNHNDAIHYWKCVDNGNMIFPEHNDTYLQECLENLRSKGINIDFS